MQKSLIFKRLHLTNFLSYGPNSEPVVLHPLTVLIGPNGSGKSNFLEAFSLLQAAPEQVSRPIATNGGVRNWLYRGNSLNQITKSARLDIIINYEMGDLRYSLAFNEIERL